MARRIEEIIADLESNKEEKARLRRRFDLDLARLDDERHRFLVELSEAIPPGAAKYLSDLEWIISRQIVSAE